VRGKDFPISIRFLYPRVSPLRSSLSIHHCATGRNSQISSYCIEVFSGQEFLSWKSDEEGTRTLGGCRVEGGEHQHPAVLFTLIGHQTAIFVDKNREIGAGNGSLK
jgi:hypothetical protein